MARFSLALLLGALLSFVAAWDISDEDDRCGCQAYSKRPLDGCDRSKTIFVGRNSKFKTVQSGTGDSIVLQRTAC
jgi:hypothetical protein